MAPFSCRDAVALSLVFSLLVPSSVDCSLSRDYRSLQRNVSQLLDNLLNPSRYDKRIRPGFGGPPAVVTVNMLVKSMGPVSETEEEYVMDCYFRQTWQDKRLLFAFGGMEEFSLPWLFLDRVWKPDTFFMNGKKSHLHRITVPNKFLRLRHDGTLIYSMRLTIKASCPMHLRKFPLDTQKCPLFIGSYGYLSSDVVYRWQAGGNAVVEEGVELAQYDLINIATEVAQHVMRGKDEYSMLKVSFTMKRHTGYFMLQVFAPCCLIVCCSWVSFWIDPDAVPARVTLGVSSVLSMTTMGFGGRAQMPKVSYATALDWFVILCFSNVFAVMVEYAFINFIDTITTDIKRILEQKGIKKPPKPPEPPAAPAADGSAASSSPAVPVLVVDLAGADAIADPVYAEVADATCNQSGGRTRVMHNQTRQAMQRGGGGGDEEEEVLLASMVLSPAEELLLQHESPAAAVGTTPPPQPPPPPPPAATVAPPPPRQGRRLIRRKSLADLSSSREDVERGRGGGGAGGGRALLLRRASAAVGGRRASSSAAWLTVPLAQQQQQSELDEDFAFEDDDQDEDEDDEPPMDTLEALEVTIRGSVMELRETLGSVGAETRRSLRHYLQKPLQELRAFHMFPTQQSVTRLLLAEDPPPKFSNIDIAARLYFPLLFSLLLSLYWILYIYYITDDFPPRVLRVLDAREQRRLAALAA